MRQMLELLPVQEMRLEDLFGEASLPAITDRLEDSEYDEVLRTLKYADVEEYRSKTDWFLCLVLPRIKPLCLKYYEDDEERLNDLYDAHQLRKIDAVLVAQLDLFRNVLELQAVEEIA